MVKVVGVFNVPVGLLPILIGVEVPHGWQYHPGDVLCSFYLLPVGRLIVAGFQADDGRVVDKLPSCSE